MLHKTRIANLPPSKLLQSEYGDIYKVSLEYSGETVTELRVKYFDTLPPCSSICVLKTGFLFAAAEFGNHSLYQFAVRCAAVVVQAIFVAGSAGGGHYCARLAHVHLCIRMRCPSTSPMVLWRVFLPFRCGRPLSCFFFLPLSRQSARRPLTCRGASSAGMSSGTFRCPWLQGIGDEEDVESTSATTVATDEGYQPVFFEPRPLKNLAPIDEMESLSPIMDMKVRVSAPSRRQGFPISKYRAFCIGLMLHCHSKFHDKDAV